MAVLACVWKEEGGGRLYSKPPTLIPLYIYIFFFFTTFLSTGQLLSFAVATMIHLEFQQ